MVSTASTFSEVPIVSEVCVRREIPEHLRQGQARSVFTASSRFRGAHRIETAPSRRHLAGRRPAQAEGREGGQARSGSLPAPSTALWKPEHREPAAALLKPCGFTACQHLPPPCGRPNTECQLPPPRCPPHRDSPLYVHINVSNAVCVGVASHRPQADDRGRPGSQWFLLPAPSTAL